MAETGSKLHIYITIQKKWEGHVDKMSPDRIPEKY
jgi:hypothetical protein